MKKIFNHLRSADLIKMKVKVCYEITHYLGSPNISSCLEPNGGVPALSDLLLGEVPLVLGGHLGSYLRPRVLWVHLSDSAQGEEAEHHLGNIPGLEQVWGLEHLLLGHSVPLGSCKERLHILHQHEC